MKIPTGTSFASGHRFADSAVGLPGGLTDPASALRASSYAPSSLGCSGGEARSEDSVATSLAISVKRPPAKDAAVARAINAVTFDHVQDAIDQVLQATAAG
jgi:hypothetical protein